VRTAAAEQIRPIIGVFGVEWATKKLLPQIFEVQYACVSGPAQTAHSAILPSLASLSL
jgi:hypothetical protein